MNDDTEKTRGDGAGEGVDSAIVRRVVLGSATPANFEVVRDGGGVRLKIVDRDKAVSRNGSVTYVFAWARDVDTTSKTSLDAGAARAEQCGQVAAPGVRDAVATYYLADTRYGTGVFYCWGVDSGGIRSTEYLWSSSMSGEILDSTVPADWSHFSVSESGEEVTPGVVVSMLTVAAWAPNPLGSCDGLQLYLRDYTKLGSIEESDFRRYNGAAGGSIAFKVPLGLVRRKGTGTINVTAGVAAFTVTSGRLLADTQAGDQLELLGLRATLLAPTNNTTGTLSAVWAGATGSFTDWKVVPLVTVYGVSISKGGTRRTDIENSPSQKVLFDGDLSAPVQLGGIVATTMGNAIRIDVPYPVGTGLDVLHLWRSPNADSFLVAVELDSIKLNRSLPATGSGLLQFVDEKFTTYERETGAQWTYYVTVTNIRGDSSPASLGAVANCRLDTGKDISPPTTARQVALNLLWNGQLRGDNLTVNVATAAQDAGMGGVAPAAPVYRWDQSVGGGGSAPSFANDTEVLLAFTGVPNTGVTGDSTLKQRSGAWDNATNAQRRIAKGKPYVLQFKARTTGGSINGDIIAQIYQYDGGGVYTGNAKAVRRLSDDSIDTTQLFHRIVGTTLVTTHQVYWGVFLPDITLTTADIWVLIGYNTSNWYGVNVYLTDVMLSMGETLPGFTSQLADPKIVYAPPAGTTPVPYSRYPDGEGRGRNYIPVIP